MKKTFRTVALILAAVLTVGMLAFPAAASGTADEEKWVDNVLIKEPLQAFQIDLKHIRSVTFLDSTADAPGNRTSLVAQTVKHLSTMRETWVQSLGREDPLEKERAIHSSTIAWKIPWTEEAWQATVHGLAWSQT